MDIMNWKLLLAWLILKFSVVCTSSMLAEKQTEQMAIEGSSYKMKCAEGKTTQTSLPYIYWTINGQPPRVINQSKLNQGTKYKILRDGLVIRNVSKEDALSNYTCVAFDPISFVPIHKQSVQLKIRQRAGKTLERSYLSTTMGSKVKVWGVVRQWKTLPCNMFSRPSPTFEWRDNRSGNQIKNLTDLYRIHEEDGHSNLTIFIHNDTMFGEYTCKGSNILGESTQHFILEKGYRPQPPFIFPTFIGKDRITFKIEPQESFQQDLDASNSINLVLPVINYIIQYQVDDNDNDTTLEAGTWLTAVDSPDVNERTGDIFIEKQNGGIFELKNLKENTTYVVRSAVSNTAAMSDFSQAVRVTTDAILILKAAIKISANLFIWLDAHVEMKEDRQKYRKSFEDGIVSMNISAEMKGNEPMDCKNPRFRKTIIITTTTTTLIEDMKSSYGSNSSSLIKKLVEEDTTVDRMFMCTK